MPTVLLIDDRADALEALAAAIREVGADITVDAWRPTDDQDPLAEFQSRLEGQVSLVATDFDLTQSMRGLFGSTIASWCESRLIPVCNFSRAHDREALRDKGLFDLRVPPETGNAAKRIAQLASGFDAIGTRLQKLFVDGDLASFSPATALAQVLDRPDLASDLAPYLTRVGAANGALVLALKADNPGSVSAQDKARVLTYVVGHVLINGILEFPGPILSSDALLAYCAANESDRTTIETALSDARYCGPFAAEYAFFWRSMVDEIFDAAADGVDDSRSFDEYNRTQCSSLIARPIAPHDQCPQRCNGTRGGFWCPFSKRPVCDREDCSVTSSSWIPFGADLSRIEREFYDEWAPLLGY